MAGIRIEWVFRNLVMPVDLRDMFFRGAEQRWANVITDWPRGADGRAALRALTIEVDDTANLNPNGPRNGSFIVAHVDLLKQLPGSAGPAAFIPTRAQILLDSVRFPQRLQLEPSAIRDLIAHEMGHALGFGEIWQQRGLLVQAAGKVFFTGQHALAEYRSWDTTAHATSTGVPVEDVGGRNTAFEHWKEDPTNKSQPGLKLFYELMSGSLEHGDNRLSRLTVAAMKDLGYTVNIDAAEAYRIHE